MHINKYTHTQYTCKHACNTCIHKYVNAYILKHICRRENSLEMLAFPVSDQCLEDCRFSQA